MKTLFYIPSGLQTPELEIMLSLVQNSIDSGHDVYIAVCSGGSGYACSFNIWGLRGVCNACKARTSQGLNLLHGDYAKLDLPSIDINNDNKIPIKNVEELKNYQYRNLDLGQSVYSSYIGSTRDLGLDGAFWKKSVGLLLQTSKTITDWFFDLNQRICFDRIFLYNGRQNQYRPIFRSSIFFSIPVTVVEFSGLSDDCVYEFENALPQDLDMLNDRINNLWETTVGDRDNVSQYYFSFKRSGGFVNDVRSYVTSQKINKLPSSWDDNLTNIVIFNSSEDEFAALGGAYDESVYPSQYDAISHIASKFSERDDLMIWLRIHPNLKNVKWDFSTRLFELEKVFKNFRVIPGDSEVSSYAVLDASDLVVSFGSTMGIEASYWSKPSILLSRCIYEKSGSVYVPKSKEEVVSLISRAGELPPLDKTGACKAAFFWSRGGHSVRYFSGSRADGFQFKGFAIKQTYLHRFAYNISKIYEKYVVEKVFNFALRVIVGKGK